MQTLLSKTFARVGAFALTLVCLDVGTAAEKTAGLQTDRIIRRGYSQCNRIAGAQIELYGFVSSYLRGITEQWLKVAPFSNPAMLEMFRDRDRLPRRNLEPWAGEFAGKYLTSAVQVYRVTGDATLRATIKAFVDTLVDLQDADGYLGPWPQDSRLTGRAPNVGRGSPGNTWDAWGHYHIMLGLLLWHEESREDRALDCAKKIGGLICQKFLNGSQRLVDTGSTEMNLAVIHSLCLLYRSTLAPRYLQMARQISEEFAAENSEGKPLAGDYLRAALAGKEFYQMPRPRWESLHPIMGLAELYWLTGEQKYRQAFERIWWSIVKLDRHNNGGFSSGEQAQGNPYHPGAIETCCTIAWIAMSVEMLRLTGDSVVADEIELSTLNSIVGLHSPTGRWVTYNTPMDGVKRASAHDIVFQAREGSPELNCCSVNGARGFGMISDWALMADKEGLVLNWFGPASFKARLPSGRTVTLTQETDYPRDSRIRLQITPSRPEQFALKVRIPYWSAATTVKLNRRAVPNVVAGKYLVLDRKWQRGDVVEVELDLSFHYWAGERECRDKTSIYRGPILLAYDRRFNRMDPNDVPALDARSLQGKVVSTTEWMPPVLLMEFIAMDGRTVRLCDFGSAGTGGSPYRSWLPVKNVRPREFAQSNPLRSGRAE